MTRVGVVVPCKDEIATIERCLRSVRDQRLPPVRVIVVDNGSTDGSLAVARRLADEVLEVPTGTISGLRNRGAAAVGPVDVLAFVDADVVLDTGWTAAATAVLDTADLVSSRSAAPADATWVARRWAAIEERTATGTSAAWSQALAVRHSTFIAVGGFDERLRTAEDADLSARVRQMGGRVVLDPSLRAVHHGFAPDLRAFARRERWHTSTPGWFHRMSPASRALVAATAAWTVSGIVSTADRRAARTWAVVSAAGVPALGRVVGGTARHAAQDGALLALWALVRSSRLSRGLRRPTG